MNRNVRKEVALMEENYYNNEVQKEEPTNQYSYNTDYNYGTGQKYGGQDNEVMSVGQWLLTILATIVPCVGLILYLVWAFGSSGNQNRKNYCRAWLIYYAIATVLSTIIAIIIIAVAASAGSYYYY